MSRPLTVVLAVLVGIAILVGVAVNVALVVFSVMSSRDIVRREDQVSELTSVVAVLNQSLQEASSFSELRLQALTSSRDLRLDSLNSSFTTSLLAVSSNQTALALRQGDLERSTVPLMSCQHYRDGVYTLYLQDGGRPFPVYCDMASDGYGWVVFQRRVDGSEDFYRTWADYKAGFGRLEAEFWLGNDKLHRLISVGLTRLRVDLGDWQNDTAYALHSSFSVVGEEDNYRLNVSGYNGTAGDALTSLSGREFSTRDRDNDLRADNCAVDRGGAWWYGDCTWTNLNGLYNITATGNQRAVTWYYWKNEFFPLNMTEMKVR